MARAPGNRRSGAALVEFALVAPIFFLVLFLFIEFDRYVFAVNAMQEAARGACRSAILKSATSADVNAKVSEILAPTGIDTFNLSVTPSLTSTFEQGDLITVSITANYRDISWLPTLRFFEKAVVRASCTMPREG